jgi:acetyltransferase-like isoleucine patch superfamily enzyme
VYLSPRATLCGQVLVNDSVFIGAGAVVVPGATIGKGATIDALVRVTGPVSAGARLSMTRPMETKP